MPATKRSNRLIWGKNASIHSKPCRHGTRKSEPPSLGSKQKQSILFRIPQEIQDQILEHALRRSGRIYVRQYHGIVPVRDGLVETCRRLKYLATQASHRVNNFILIRERSAPWPPKNVARSAILNGNVQGYTINTPYLGRAPRAPLRVTGRFAQRLPPPPVAPPTKPSWRNEIGGKLVAGEKLSKMERLIAKRQKWARR